jgi:hypothetical protein
LKRDLISSINDHIYNSLIWHISNRLIESCRMSSRLIKILHYWVWWVSSTEKSRFRDDRDEVSSQNAWKKSVFLNNIVNSQTFFDLSSKYSLNQRYFLTFLLCFQSSKRRRRDTTHLYLFTCVEHLLKFVEISFANICVNAIFERIKLSQRLRRRKNSK